MTSGIKHRLISPGIIAVIAALLLAGGVLFANHLLESPLQRSVNFEIERGSALNTVLHRLTSDDITLLNKLRRGDVITYSITFPEGWHLSQWLDLMKSEPAIAITLSSAAEVAGKIEGIQGDSQGQFFPDTYSYTKNATDTSILRRAHLRMQKVLDEAWLNRTDGVTLKSKHEALILASIIEKETGVSADRSAIAGVFVNRLSQGMKLQSDPTVIFGMEDFDGDLKRRHLRTPSPYNTYTIPRLPIGPICNPGAGSIAAALNPPESDYLYFVAKGDGTSYFSTSLEEHNAAVVQFQKAGRVKNYSSTPKE